VATVRKRTCGAKGNRTLGLDSAIVALYQLSYSPNVTADCIGRQRWSARLYGWPWTGPVYWG
jgi:hypothetical protein